MAGNQVVGYDPCEAQLPQGANQGLGEPRGGGEPGQIAPVPALPGEALEHAVDEHVEPGAAKVGEVRPGHGLRCQAQS